MSDGRKSAGAQIPLIDVLRGVSILAVLCGHFTSVPGPTYTNRFGPIFNSFARNGAYGVSMFFVISRFIITRMIDGTQGRLFSPDLQRFYVRRFSRIIPMLILVCAIGVSIINIGASRSGALEVTFKDPKATFDWLFWSSIFLFFFNLVRIRSQSTSMGYGMNWDVLWSLAIEEQFYLGYPWLLRTLGSPRRLGLFLAAVIATGPAYRFYAFRQNPESFLLGFTHSLAAFDQLAIGIMAYLVTRRWNLATPITARRVCAIIGLTIATWTYLWTYAGDPIDRIYGPSLLGIGVAMIIVGAHDLPRFGGSSWRPLRWVGEASYEAYLLHSLVLYLLWPYLARHQRFFVPAAVFVFTATCVAVVVHRWIEEPVKRWCSRTAMRMLRGAST
jgi:peptidoglycan/LPS O-acetylase OafA/YrhL